MDKHVSPSERLGQTDLIQSEKMGETYQKYTGLPTKSKTISHKEVHIQSF